MDKNGKSYRLKQHLMPPSGWLNDPNGLCFYKGNYHVFFQYAPKDPWGKERYWGHYVSKDLIHWRYENIGIYSDCEWDRSGAYSGCSFTEDGSMEIFYTGNVKEPGNYDYIKSGRQANVITITSEDGIHFSPKELLLTNKDYPSDFTCHVRDPKVWKKHAVYYMVLGGRKYAPVNAVKSCTGNTNTDSGDRGAILLYQSEDKKKWQYKGELTTKDYFGYMWECPDVFALKGHTVCMCCPQGVARGKENFQNIYPSGYFVLSDREPENLSGLCKKEQFREWDHGFDFYAPQTFLDHKNRRILIGWAGVPEMEKEYSNTPIIEEGWQHSLTLPRELVWKNGQVYQYPVEEIDTLRGKKLELKKEDEIIQEETFDLIVRLKKASHIGSDSCMILLNDEVQLKWEQGVFSLSFLNQSGGGRKIRKCRLNNLSEIRILKDVSMFEIYLNKGEAVMTSRYFPQYTDTCYIKLEGDMTIELWEMKKMEVDYNGAADN